MIPSVAYSALVIIALPTLGWIASPGDRARIIGHHGRGKMRRLDKLSERRQVPHRLRRILRHEQIRRRCKHRRRRHRQNDPRLHVLQRQLRIGCAGERSQSSSPRPPFAAPRRPVEWIGPIVTERTNLLTERRKQPAHHGILTFLEHWAQIDAPFRRLKIVSCPPPNNQGNSPGSHAWNRRLPPAGLLRTPRQYEGKVRVPATSVLRCEVLSVSSIPMKVKYFCSDSRSDGGEHPAPCQAAPHSTTARLHTGRLATLVLRST